MKLEAAEVTMNGGGPPQVSSKGEVSLGPEALHETMTGIVKLERGNPQATAEVKEIAQFSKLVINLHAVCPRGGLPKLGGIRAWSLNFP
jgi:hypothetical protein